MNRIVVGIDGSEESRGALRWALAEAKLRGAPLRVVHTWLYPYLAVGPGIDAVLDSEVFDNADKVANDLVRTELASVDTGDVEVEETVVEGPPASLLLEAAQDADLLVLGSRGRGGFTGLLLGSVSQQCAHHAPCPVVIVSRP